ncbi:MAG TPA: RDD family protein [Actinomycetota bacterium]|nr:RDD family protein [Actinomycetota bacterium]
MSTDANSIVTPEAVALDLDLAELGSRVGAYAIDFLVQIGIWVALAILTGIGSAFGLLGSSATGQAIVFAIGFIVVFWGYFPLFEEIWNGRTIGKRALGLRVVRVSGQPSGFVSILVRNLLRPIDMALLGPIFMVLTRRHQRIGDLAAGTVVIREAKKAQPVPVMLTYGPAPDLPLDTSGLTDQEYGLIRSFLERRYTLDPGARGALSAQLAGMVRGKVPGSMAYGWGDEILLEAVLATVRQRYLQAPAYAGTWAPPPVTLPVDLVAPALADGALGTDEAIGARADGELGDEALADELDLKPFVLEPPAAETEAPPEAGPVEAVPEPEVEAPPQAGPVEVLPEPEPEVEAPPEAGPVEAVPEPEADAEAPPEAGPVEALPEPEAEAEAPPEAGPVEVLPEPEAEAGDIGIEPSLNSALDVTAVQPEPGAEVELEAVPLEQITPAAIAEPTGVISD